MCIPDSKALTYIIVAVLPGKECQRKPLSTTLTNLRRFPNLFEAPQQPKPCSFEVHPVGTDSKSNISPTDRSASEIKKMAIDRLVSQMVIWDLVKNCGYAAHGLSIRRF